MDRPCLVGALGDPRLLGTEGPGQPGVAPRLPEGTGPHLPGAAGPRLSGAIELRPAREFGPRTEGAAGLFAAGAACHNHGSRG
jgi:hypothetical protein